MSVPDHGWRRCGGRKNHYLTDDYRRPDGRCLAVCGAEIHNAGPCDPELRYCGSCAEEIRMFTGAPKPKDETFFLEEARREKMREHNEHLLRSRLKVARR